MMSEDNARKVIEIIKSSGGFPVSLKSLITTMAFRHGASEDEANTAIGIAAMDDSVSFRKEGSDGEPAGFIYLNSSARTDGVEEVCEDDDCVFKYAKIPGMFTRIIDQINLSDDKWYTDLELLREISPRMIQENPNSIHFSIKKIFGPKGSKHHAEFRRGVLPSGQWLYRKKQENKD